MNLIVTWKKLTIGHTNGKRNLIPILTKQANSNSFSYPPVKFNVNNITKCSHQKHLGIVLDLKLNLNTHIDQKIKKCNKLIGLMKRLSVDHPQSALLTIYKSFFRPHLEYGDILYDKLDNESFQNKIEKVQYKACLAITDEIEGTSREKLYKELGLHSLVERRRPNKLISFYKIVNGLLLDYLYSYLNFASQQNHPLRSAKASKIMPILTRTKSFKKSFFPYCINVWNNLKAEIRNAKSISIFKKIIVRKKHENSLFSVYDPLSEKLLTRLRLKFSNLKEHKFRHGFADMINPTCACGADVKTTEHFLLHCHFYSTQRLELVSFRPSFIYVIRFKNKYFKKF